mgnify:CR=1 FL=1
MPIDVNAVFLPVRIALMTISDTRTLRDDRSGEALVESIHDAGHELAARVIEIDDIERIVERLKEWIDDPNVDCIVTTGGTGVTGRDVTPEALAQVADKHIPGFGELFRLLSFENLRAAGQPQRRQGWVGRHIENTARQPLSPLQLCRADAAPSGALKPTSDPWRTAEHEPRRR